MSSSPDRSFRSSIRDLVVQLLGRLHQPPLESDPPVYRFLTYHRIKPEQQLSFKYQLDFLIKHYNLVSPTDFRNDNGSTETLNLLLTFDDGYFEWETFVLQELEKRDLECVFFVTPDFVGLGEPEYEEYCREHLRIEPARPLTEDGLNRLLDSDHEVGNHLLKHVDLRQVDDTGTLRNVFEDSQETFERRYGYTPSWLAYPFADYFSAPDELQSVAEDYFDYATTLIPGWNDSTTSPFLLHRDGFSPELSGATVRGWLRGGYDPIFRLTHLLKPHSADRRDPS